MRGFKFNSPVIIRIQGKHARRFLQNRLSNDIAALSLGKHCQAAALTAQGKVEVYGVCICEGDNSFLYYTTGGDPKLILESLSRFRVTEHVDFIHVTDGSLIHITEEISCGSAAYLLPITRISTKGFDLLSLDTSTANSLDCLSASEFYRLRFESNHALFPEEIGSDMLLPETGNAEAISFTKGCYVGQEVVAKIESLGRPPRLLRRVEAEKPLSLSKGQKLTNLEGRLNGEIRSWLNNDRIGFALIKSNDSSQDCFAEGARLRIL